MRLTRAALRAEAAGATPTIHVDHDPNVDMDMDVVEQPSTPLPQTSDSSAPIEEQRPALEDISANLFDAERAVVEEMAGVKGSKKGTRGRPRKEKGKRDVRDVFGEEAQVVEDREVPQVVEDADEVGSSAASDAAVEDLIKDGDELNEVVVREERPPTPPSRAVRLTRRKLAKDEEKRAEGEQALLVVTEGEVEQPEGAMNEVVVPEAEVQPAGSEAIHSPIPQIEQPEQAIEQATVAPSPAKAKAEEEDSFVKEITSRSPSKLRMRPEDSIEAIDTLEDAIEEVGKALQSVKALPSPTKQRKTRNSPATKTVAPTRTVSVKQPTPTATKVTAVQRSVSNAQRPRPSSVIVSSTRPLKGSSVTRSASVRKTSPNAEPITNAEGSEEAPKQKPIDYLASRRRPISLSFPTPPPPPKSTKPATRPTFQLPGEAVAAKLKAQREERLKKEQEEAGKTEEKKDEKKEFKARPVPKSIRKSSAKDLVKPTKASLARESLMTGVPLPEPTKRVPSATGTTGTTTLAATRASTMANKRVPLSSTSVTIAPLRKSPQQPRPRPSTAAITVTKRTSTVPTKPPAASSTTTTTTTATRSNSGTIKGKEVFNRNKLEKEEMEKQKREKEDAARKARAEAAERGRQASREWAEKMRVKRMSVVGAGVGMGGKKMGVEGGKEVETKA